MTHNHFVIIVFVSILTANTAMADYDKCAVLQDVAKTETINGKSNIPEETYVVASERKVYFYTAPDTSCKQDGKFVIAGDFMYAYKLHGGFTYVKYITTIGKEVKGWVKSSELSDFSPIVNKIHKKSLSIADFIVINQSNWFGLGDSFSNDKNLMKENKISSEYIGDFPNGNGGLNKFYSHKYKDFTVIGSNINYNERLWTIDDDYIISTITLTTSKYHTNRNIRIGDEKESILKAYNGINFNESNDTMIYSLGEISVSFRLVNNKVRTIEMTLISAQQ